MRKKIVVLILFTLAVINITLAGFRILDIERKTKLLVLKNDNSQTLDISLYNISSLTKVISKLQDEIAAQESSRRKNGDNNTLEMTKDVLFLFEHNRIKVISYRLEDEENTEVLALTGEGKPSSVLKLIYELSFSGKGFSIEYLSVDAGLPEKPVTLIIRITYA